MTTQTLTHPVFAPRRVGSSVPSRPALYVVPSVTLRPAAKPVRLTRRGRLTLFCVAVLVALVAAVWLQAGAPAIAGTDLAPPATSTVVVEPGQTLWQIARDVRPGADPRETIARIQELNGLSTATVWAGQPLIVPA